MCATNTSVRRSGHRGGERDSMGRTRRKSWSEYILKTCKSLHHCKLCGRDITYGQRYHDGGYNHRAHETCVASGREGEVGHDEIR